MKNIFIISIFYLSSCSSQNENKNLIYREYKLDSIYYDEAAYRGMKYNEYIGVVKGKDTISLNEFQLEGNLLNRYIFDVVKNPEKINKTRYNAIIVIKDSFEVKENENIDDFEF